MLSHPRSPAAAAAAADLTLTLPSPYPHPKAWLAKQEKDVKAKGAFVRLVVQDATHWEAVALLVRVLAPVLTLLRLVDGKKGATLGKVYALFAQLDKLFREKVTGMDTKTSERMHQLFMARWTYFHEPIFTCASVCLAHVCV